MALIPLTFLQVGGILIDDDSRRITEHCNSETVSRGDVEIVPVVEEPKPPVVLDEFEEDRRRMATARQARAEEDELDKTIVNSRPTSQMI